MAQLFVRPQPVSGSLDSTGYDLVCATLRFALALCRAVYQVAYSLVIGRAHFEPVGPNQAGAVDGGFTFMFHAVHLSPAAPDPRR